MDCYNHMIFRFIQKHVLTLLQNIVSSTTNLGLLLPTVYQVVACNDTLRQV